MSVPTTISLKRARRMALRAQLLVGTPARRSAVTALRTIEHLGYVQIDTIAVIERAHHHILWTRQPGYDPAMLDRLLARDRAVFEYWTHAASYIPMSDYRFYLPRMQTMRDSERVREWKQANQGVIRHVRARIRAEGPLASADFKDTRQRRGSWWDWKPAKRALEILFDTGELMVTRRRNFQRIYDLTERVLPDDIDTRLPTEEEAGQFFVRRLVGRMGIVSRRDVLLKQGHRREPLLRSLQALVESGDLARLRVTGREDSEWYGFPEALEATARSRVGNRLHLLSPFDNMIIRRDWLQQTFDFRYRLECYYPEAKRTFGYFTLPILWGDTFVGRLDAKADRKEGTLVVKNIWFENDFRDEEGLAEPLAAKLEAFAAFNDCHRIALSKTTSRIAPILESCLDNGSG